MEACERILYRKLDVNVDPPRSSPEAFSRDIFSHPKMIELVKWDEETRWAKSAEIPSELARNMEPNDGHQSE